MRKRTLLFLGAIALSIASFGQFETPQLSGEDFENVKIHVGADFAMQYQVINHHADSALIPLGTGFNLPTANSMYGSIACPGIKVSLTTYLSPDIIMKHG